jgi:hypothetical protein
MQRVIAVAFDDAFPRAEDVTERNQLRVDTTVELGRTARRTRSNLPRLAR